METDRFTLNDSHIATKTEFKNLGLILSSIFSFQSQTEKFMKTVPSNQEDR